MKSDSFKPLAAALGASVLAAALAPAASAGQNPFALNELQGGDKSGPHRPLGF